MASLLPILVFWALCALPQSGMAESRFRDDFNRPDSAVVGNDWNITPNHNECARPDRKRPPGGEKPSLHPEKPDAAKKKSDPSGPGATAAPGKGGGDRGLSFQGATARIRDGMLFFQYEQNQDAQMAQQEFSKKIQRLSFDFTPLYAMGGMDDRAWVGARIYYLDKDGLILGEIRHFFYHAVFPELENTATVHTIVQEGPFDGTSRQVTIDAQQLLNHELRAVDQSRIAKSRLSLEISSGLCESSVEAYMDNVALVMEEIAEPFRVTREVVLEMMELTLAAFGRDRGGFPESGRKAVFDKFGKEKLQPWLNEIPPEARRELGRMTDFLAQRFRLTGKEAWLAGYALFMLMQP